MKSLVWLPLVCAGAAVGCVTEVPDDADYPILPGGDGVNPRAGTGGGSNVIRGRVCLANDFIDRSECATTGVGGLQVDLGDERAVTQDDGSFELTVPAGQDTLVYVVTGDGVIPTQTPFTGAGLEPTVPVVGQSVYDGMLAANEIELPVGTGSVMGSVLRAGVPVQGVTVTSSTSTPFGTFYDGDTAGFGLNGTGARGVYYVPGLMFGTTDLSINDPGSGRSTLVNGIPVLNGGITILDSVVLP